MTPEQFGSLIAELHQIRVVLTILVVLMGVIVLAIVVRFGAKASEDTFRSKADHLIEAGDHKRLESLSLRVLRKRPNFALAHWFLARAYELQGHTQAALKEYERTRELAPHWGQASIDPRVTNLKKGTDAAP
jgi:hypothetical protein